MPNVYVSQNPLRRDKVTGELIHSFDLTHAREFGNLEVLLAAGVAPVQVSPESAVRQLRAKLRHFQRGDHLLCLGDPVAIAAAAAIVASVNDGVIPLLVWDRRISRYVEITVDIMGREVM